MSRAVTREQRTGLRSRAGAGAGHCSQSSPGGPRHERAAAAAAADSNNLDAVAWGRDTRDLQRPLTQTCDNWDKHRDRVTTTNSEET